mgnify:CR=1 FL=1
MKTLRLLLALVAGCIGASAADKPNIIVILVDDMGFSDLGCYGSEIPTPNLDALAKQGMVFTSGYAAAGNCAPSRACRRAGTYRPSPAG